MILDKAALDARDAADPLAFARARFRLPEGVIYLDGNSLGALPKATPARMAEAVEGEWGGDLITSWNKAGWMELPHRIGAQIAALIGASPEEVVAGDSTSVALFKLAAAAVRLRPRRSVILSERGNFPTDLYVLEGVADITGRRLQTVDADAIETALNDDVALLVLTHVDYRTGRILDMKRLTDRAHAAGALVLWDLSHSAGALELDLSAAGADFAVGCGYKYFNGGPGAPGYMMAARRHQEQIRQPVTGWIGHAAPFAFEDRYAPASGMGRFLTGTPAVLGLVALEAGLRTFDGVDMAMVRQKSKALGQLFIDLVEARLPEAFTLASPRDAAARGSQVSLRHPDAYAIVQALIEAGVVGDFRAPDIARFGLTPLYLGFADIGQAVDRLVRIMESGIWREARFAVRQAVT